MNIDTSPIFTLKQIIPEEEKVLESVFPQYIWGKTVSEEIIESYRIRVHQNGHIHLKVYDITTHIMKSEPTGRTNLAIPSFARNGEQILNYNVKINTPLNLFIQSINFQRKVSPIYNFYNKKKLKKLDLKKGKKKALVQDGVSGAGPIFINDIHKDENEELNDSTEA